MQPARSKPPGRGLASRDYLTRDKPSLPLAMHQERRSWLSAGSKPADRLVPSREVPRPAAVDPTTQLEADFPVLQSRHSASQSAPRSAPNFAILIDAGPGRTFETGLIWRGPSTCLDQQ